MRHRELESITQEFLEQKVEADEQKLSEALRATEPSCRNPRCGIMSSRA